MTKISASLLACVLALSSLSSAWSQKLRLEPGDHVAYIGNTTADRMQHHGWLETYLHALHPEHNLTFRNLGFSGDEIKLRQRADNFGDPDQWLSKCQADVVACFFGYNEALKGEAGLSSFRQDLAEMIQHMRGQRYNGESAPRLLVFSPIAHEDLNSPHLPDGEQNNRHLAMYTDVMRQVCEQTETPFVDLFTISLRLYEQEERPLTINGIHLADHGNRAVAQAVLQELYPQARIPADASIAALREAVLDKNYHWFSRYRVVDEYNVFGGRSKLAWFGQSNADVMMREMEIFDVMTANRDKRIWAVARGGDLVVKDDNLPAELEVRTNKPGPLEGGKFPYLDGEAAIEKMQVQEGLEVNLFASEKEFPRLVNPVQMSVDTDGRLWASVWPSYPHWNPTEPRRDALVILPDEDQDGKADELIVFADELNSITGFEFWGGGVLVAAPPEIWFLKDTDGDDRADQKIRVLQGVSSADTHHSANAMLIGPDGWLYWSRGIFNVAAFETPTKTYRSGESGVHRFNPRTFEVEFHYPIGPNPHGDVFDRWGFQFANDGTSGTGGYVSIGKGQRPGGKQWFKKEWRPVAATGILSSSHFPEESQNNFLICNCIGFLGVLQYQVQYDGAEITAVRTTDLLRSSDENFRPSDIEVGGDGALYVSDWHNVLIGHMQHNMRDPNRDHEHGRIYRITAKGRPTLPPAKMKGRPIAEVLEHFFARENGVRYRARLELSGRESDDVIAGVAKFADSLDPAQASPERDQAQALLECLWVLEEHRAPNMELVRKTFQAAEPRVRAAAIRTLGHWAGRVRNWEDLLQTAARDDAPLVRAEAAKAAVEFQNLAAAEVIFEVASRPTDSELDDVLAFATQSINADAMIADAIRSGKSLSQAAQAYALRSADPALLVQMGESPEVYAALLARPSIPAEFRWRAVRALAKLHGASEIQQLASSILTAEQQTLESLPDLAAMLAGLGPQQLSAASDVLRELAVSAQSSDARVAAYAAWMQAADAQTVWREALQSRTKLADALEAIRTLDHPPARNALFPLVRRLMFELPPELEAGEAASSPGSGPPIAFEYYEPNPAQNVALETLDQAQPKATGVMEYFSKYAPDGAQDAFALRMSASIVVPQSGAYRFFTASDDGSRLYIDGKLVVDNDGLHGMNEKGGRIRLDAGPHEIVVTYFDNGGGDGLQVLWQGPGLNKQPIPPEVLQPSRGASLKAKALQVIAAWPGRLNDKVDDFKKLMEDDSLAALTLDALAGLPGNRVAERLNSEEAANILTRVLEQAQQATPAERQTPPFARLLSLGGFLVARVDANPDDALRKLAELKASIPVKADPKVMALGQEVYSRESHCATCHQPHGQGLPNLYPPLDGSIWATGSEERMIRMVLDGMHGTIEVKGKRYSSPPLPPMTGFRHLLNDEEIAAVLTYVRNSWSNRAKPVTASQVANVRAIDRGDASFWAANDLLALFPLEDGSKPIIDTTSDGWVPKFVKNWTSGDLEPSQWPAQGRSFEQGRLAFQRIGCAQCHKLGDTGGVFGPNLAELDPKKKNQDYVLQAILNPSKDIDPKYAMYTFVLTNGKVVSGLVTKETASQIELVSDPLNQSEPTVINKDDIEDQAKTANSIMPQGLLNWLSEEEIRDLVAYVLAAGKEDDPFFAK